MDNAMNMAMEMFKIHNDFRFKLHELAERSGFDEKELLTMAINVLTNELDAFVPETERTSDAELTAMASAIF